MKLAKFLEWVIKNLVLELGMIWSLIYFQDGVEVLQHIHSFQLSRIQANLQIKKILSFIFMDRCIFIMKELSNTCGKIVRG